MVLMDLENTYDSNCREEWGKDVMLGSRIQSRDAKSEIQEVTVLPPALNHGYERR